MRVTYRRSSGSRIRISSASHRLPRSMESFYPSIRTICSKKAISKTRLFSLEPIKMKVKYELNKEWKKEREKEIKEYYYSLKIIHRIPNTLQRILFDHFHISILKFVYRHAWHAWVSSDERLKIRLLRLIIYYRWSICIAAIEINSRTRDERNERHSPSCYIDSL